VGPGITLKAKLFDTTCHICGAPKKEIIMKAERSWNIYRKLKDLTQELPHDTELQQLTKKYLKIYKNDKENEGGKNERSNT
jgi:hypothetical protein